MARSPPTGHQKLLTEGGRRRHPSAYNDPNAEADRAKYRSYYGLSACTAANGCFRKVSQAGSTTFLPTSDAGWSEESSLDLDMASAGCGAEYPAASKYVTAVGGTALPKSSSTSRGWTETDGVPVHRLLRSDRRPAHLRRHQRRLARHRRRSPPRRHPVKR